MNKVADKNRDALNSHSKNRTGQVYKEKRAKFNPLRKKRVNPLILPIITLIFVGLLSFIGYLAVRNYQNYVKRPAPAFQETSEIAKFTSLMEDGKVKMKEANYKGAVDDFHAALEICPNNAETQNALKEAEKRLAAAN